MDDCVSLTLHNPDDWVRGKTVAIVTSFKLKHSLTNF